MTSLSGIQVWKDYFLVKHTRCGISVHVMWLDFIAEILSIIILSVFSIGRKYILSRGCGRILPISLIAITRIIKVPISVL